MAWRDPRVRSVAQFLLYDALPDRRYPAVELQVLGHLPDRAAVRPGRQPKPAFGAYRLPIWLPSTVRPAAAACSCGASFAPRPTARSSRR